MSPSGLWGIKEPSRLVCKPSARTAGNRLLELAALLWTDVAAIMSPNYANRNADRKLEHSLFPLTARHLIGG